MSKTFTYDEVKEASLVYFDGDELAAKVFADKYAMKKMSSEGTWEYYEKTPTDMHRRLAKEFARIEKKYPNPMSEEEIFALLDDFKFIVPQGSPMAVLGNPFHVSSLSNCVVLPKIFDSYGGIMYADQQLAQLSKRRCGVGIDISPIRPRGLHVKNSALTTDGISGYMERFSNTIREVGQSGRRGAEMITISVHHPEVETFATIKNDLTKVTGANISIFLTDEFMEAVKKNTDYEQRWPVDAKTPKIIRKVSAQKIWKTIIKSAWSSAEPGLMFWDTIQSYHPATSYDGWAPLSSNPCSEISMNADTCRLIAINMTSFVQKAFTKEATFDFTLWDSIVYKAQRLMDDMVDLEIESMEKILQKIQSDPEPYHIKAVEIETWNTYLKSAREGRRTGLGITGLGDTLAYLGIKYGSKDSIDITDKIFKAKKIAEYRASIDMARERGAFPIFDWKVEKNNAFIKQLLKDAPQLEESLKSVGRRNICISTVAPTGSLSTLTRTTSGIEPVFRLGYTRRKKITHNDQNSRVDFVDQLGDKWQHFTVYHHGVAKWQKQTGLEDATLSPYYGATSDDLDFKQRVTLQATIQKHVDHALSSTINIPKNTSVETVAEIYETAHAAGCKGITVYRDGCRDGVLITEEKKSSSHKNEGKASIERPKKIECDIYQIQAEGQKWIVLVGLVNGKPYEVFCGKPKKVEIGAKVSKGYIEKESRGRYSLHIGEDTIIRDIGEMFGDLQSALTRLVSTSLRHNVDTQFIVQQLEKSDGAVTSFSKAIARVLKKYIENGVKESGASCTECHQETLIREEGCIRCTSCGYSKCS